MSEVLGLIPARGGSKGVPRKNIRPLGGKPLIAWTIEAALLSRRLGRIIVSTDDPEISDIALSCGAEVPFVRPEELAQDHIPILSVYEHALAWLAQNEGYVPDLVAWLSPTTPLRTAADIDRAIDLLQASTADCVRSVALSGSHPYWMKRLEGDRLKPFMEGVDERTYYRRQLLPPAYQLNSAIDVTRCASVATTGQLYGGDMLGYVIPAERGIDLDTEIEFAVAALLLQGRNQ